eukprot:4787895-Pyramimonas_sp.AAC.1
MAADGRGMERDGEQSQARSSRVRAEACLKERTMMLGLAGDLTPPSVSPPWASQPRRAGIA